MTAAETATAPIESRRSEAEIESAVIYVNKEDAVDLPRSAAFHLLNIFHEFQTYDTRRLAFPPYELLFC